MKVLKYKYSLTTLFAIGIGIFNTAIAANNCETELSIESKNVCQNEKFTTNVSLKNNCSCFEATTFKIEYDNSLLKYEGCNQVNSKVIAENDGVIYVTYNPSTEITEETNLFGLEFTAIESGESQINATLTNRVGDIDIKTFNNGTINIKPTAKIDLSQIPTLVDIEDLVGLPTFGVWNGNGIMTQGYVFHADVAGIGKHKLTYTIDENDDRCANEKSIEIEVVKKCHFKIITQDYEANVGDIVDYEIAINSDCESCVSTIKFNIEYDAEKLEFVGIASSSDPQITEIEEGLLNVIASSTDVFPFVVKFKAIQPGISETNINSSELLSENSYIIKSNTSTITITGEEEGDIPIDGDFDICENDEEDLLDNEYNYYLSEFDDESTYEWSVSDNAVIVSTEDDNSEINIKFLDKEPTIITIRQTTNNYTIRSETIIKKHVKPAGKPVMPEFPNEICKKHNFVPITIPDDEEGEYHWVLPNGFTEVSGQGTGKIIVNINMTKNTEKIIVYKQDGEKCIGKEKETLTIKLTDLSNCEAIYSNSTKSFLFDEYNVKEFVNINYINNRGIELNIVPQPAKDFFTIETNSQILTTTILDAKGAIAKQSGNENKIDISQLAAGYYSLKIETTDGIFYRQLIITK